MKLLNLLIVAFTLGGVSSATPTPKADAIEPVTGTVIGTGVTEDGEPYTITSDFIELKDSKWLAEMKNYPGNFTSLEKRQGTGASLNCNQWYSNKYCYCDGAISNRGDSYWGSQEFCSNNVNRNFRGEVYHVKWLPTVKIEYWAGNMCNYDRYIGTDCGDIFLDLIDWCQWTWMAAKGGVRNFDECLWFRFDVNSR